jgi:hypothetical protein
LTAFSQKGDKKSSSNCALKRQLNSRAMRTALLTQRAESPIYISPD